MSLVPKKKLNEFKWWVNLRNKAFILSNNEYNFNFDLVDFKTVGLVFIFSAIAIPFVFSIIINYLFLNKDGTSNQTALSISLIINIIIVSFGLWWINTKIKNKLIAQGLIAFYFFYYIPLVVSLILDLFFLLSKIGVDNEGHPNVTANLVANLLADLVTLITIFIVCPLLRKKIWVTLKTKYLYLLWIVPIFLVIAYALTYVFGFFNQLANGTTSSNNQDVLNKALKNWYNILILGIYTIFIAPIVEELACRHAIFGLIGNKWLAFLASIIYFSGMHVINYGDWQDILGYLGGAIALSSIFIITEGNVLYSILTHAILNCISFILLVTMHH